MVEARVRSLVVSRSRKSKTYDIPVKKCLQPTVEVVEIDPPLDIQTLASKIYFDLPRELRDRIYTFLVQGPYDNNVIVRPAPSRPHSHSPCPNNPATLPFTLLVRQPTGPHSYAWIEDPTTLLFNTEHVGPDVAREVLECYFWTRTFTFSYQWPDLLRTFLDSDAWGLGMRPGDYVRRMAMQVAPFVEGRMGEEWEGWRLQGEFPKLTFC